MDNVDITAGVGTVVATDQVGADHYQKIKLFDATANSSAAIPGDATSGLFVNPKRSLIRVQQTPAVSTSLYASGDQLGDLMTIANAGRVSGNGGLIRGVSMLNQSNAAAFDLDLLFFDRSVTIATDNAVATFSDADMAFCVGYVQVDATDYLAAFAGTPANYMLSIPNWSSAAGTTARGSQLEIPYVPFATSLFCAAVIRGGTTLVSTSALVFSFTVERF